MKNNKIPLSKKQILLKDAIIATLVWFNFRGRALSAEEICQFLLFKKASKEAIRQELDKLDLIQRKNGFYALKHFKNIRWQYDALPWVQKKWAIAKRGSSLLEWLPWIRIIGVCNSLADKTAKPNSDIDFFIVTDKNRLFLTRLLATMTLFMYGLWRHGSNIENKICLSWYVSEDGLDLWSVSQKHKDILLAFWVSQLVPLINKGSTYERFVQENSWIAKLLPNWQQAQSNKRIATDTTSPFFFIDWLEAVAGFFQLNKIASKPKSTDPDVEIIVNRQMLKFHEIDRRRVYREAWLKECQKIGIYIPDIFH